MSASNTVGSGQTYDVSGDVVAAITLEPSATLEVASGTEASLFGGVTAAEPATIRVGVGSVLFAPAITPSDVTIVLSGVGSELMLAGSTLSEFTPTLSDIPPGALIDIAGVAVTSVTTAAIGSDDFQLILNSATGVVGTIDLDATPPSLLLAIPDGLGGSLLLAGTAPSVPIPLAAPAPTQAPSAAFVWIGSADVDYVDVTNWTEDGQAATRAPGAQDVVSIEGGRFELTTVVGAGDCATLNTSGDVSLSGAFAMSTLSVGVSTTDALVLMPGVTATAATASLVAGVLSAQSATLSVAGTFTVGGCLDGSSASAIDVASLQLDGGDIMLSADSGMIVGVGGVLASGVLTVVANGGIVGTGTIDAAVALSGSIRVSTGTLSIFGAVTGTGTIMLDAGATLFAAGGLGSATIAFGPGSGTTLETYGGLSAADVVGFAQGDVLEVANAGIGPLSWSPSGSGGTLDLGPYGSISIALASDLDPQHAQFVEAADGFGGVAITAIPCFVAATRLRTPDGWIKAGEVTPGTWLSTAAGAARRAVWVGRTVVQGRRRGMAPYLDPVLLRSGALGLGRPGADLRLSPLHGIVADTASGRRVIPAVALCDGRRIMRERAGCSFDYVHIALDRHDALLAEGLACESFLPHGPDPRGQFERSSGARPPRSRPLAARLEHGALLRDIRHRHQLHSPPAFRPLSRGNIDRVQPTANGHRVEGWADGSGEVRLLIDGQVAWQGYASTWRADLEAAGINGGQACFIATIASPHPDARLGLMR